MIDPTLAETALAGVRELVSVDGGDIELASTSGDSVRLRLVLETAECAECVMPRQFLETVALDMMQPLLPGLAVVTIDDPRDQPEMPSPGAEPTDAPAELCHERLRFDSVRGHEPD